MKFTIVVAISLATLASLCTASPLLLKHAVKKHLVKTLVARHMSPPETETVVVYTPVQQHHQVVSPVVSHHQLLPMVQPFHAKFLPDLGGLMKHPFLRKLPLLNLLPSRPAGGVVEVHHKEPEVPSAPYPPAVPSAPYPPAVVHELPEEPEPEYVPVPVEPTPAPEYVAPVVPTPAPVVPAPVYGLPAPVYGPPESTGMEFSSSSSSSSSMNVAEPTGAKYVAVNPGARHEAPLPGHTQSVVFENLQPAAGTEGLTQLPPVVQVDQRNLWNPVEAEVYQLSPDYLRLADDQHEGEGPRDAVEHEARYVAINGDLRHEAPLPGYDHSIVIENLDKV